MGSATGAVGPNSKKYGTISLTFSVTSSYESFLAFLADIESSQRLVDVSSLAFSAGVDNNYTFNVTIQTYWLK